MIDPLLGLGALALAMLSLPAAPSLDPGPSAACPADMRLVTGTHHDDVQHVCVEPVKSGKATHCFAYWEGITAEEGPTTEISVCMDQFEAPNQRGAKPLVMQSFEMATAWCAARGKRVCAEQEWELACEGPERRPLVYGWRVDRAVCNSGKAWRQVDERKLGASGEVAQREVERLWQGAPSGSYPGCASAFGIFDMMGNVEEWVASRRGRRWPGALMGGFWAKPWTGCRGTNDAHDPKFVFYETGFRCCADPRPTAAKTSAAGRGGEDERDGLPATRP
ncbi:formylglycine-generating enzyme family protein [Sorangium sp. So ce406]|uniref:formylglycine-generating enzyme family protein n=1 Tax=Sorangium sp. So ce406 TaxID=3133311 RepID=UPI003F5C5FD6